MRNALHGRWALRRSLVFPSRLVPHCRGWRRSTMHSCSLRSSCAPLAEGLHHTRSPITTVPHRPAPPRIVRPTRRVPCRSQAVRTSWACCAPLPGHTAGFGQGALCSPRRPGCVPGSSPAPAPSPPANASRSAPIAGGEIDLALLSAAAQGTLPAADRRVARVVLAETARVRPWAEPRPCISPRRRVADLHERVRTQPNDPNPNPNPNPKPNRRLPRGDRLARARARARALTLTLILTLTLTLTLNLTLTLALIPSLTLTLRGAARRSRRCARCGSRRWPPSPRRRRRRQRPTTTPAVSPPGERAAEGERAL